MMIVIGICVIFLLSCRADDEEDYFVVSNGKVKSYTSHGKEL
jgi:hypothetical protein